MAREVDLLHHKKIMKYEPGKWHHDGKGLYLRVSDKPTDTTGRTWVFIYKFNGKRKEMGLGSLDGLSLAEARTRRDGLITQLGQGVDPMEARRKELEKARIAEQGTEAAAVPLWGPRRDAYVDSIAPSFKLNMREKAKGLTVSRLEKLWRARLEKYGPDKDTDLTTIDAAFVVKLLEQVWVKNNCTAERVRGYCERIWDSAKVLKEVSGDNPFAYEGNLAAMGWKKTFRKKKKGQKAIDYRELPDFMRELAKVDSDAARALEFTIYTACRTNETAFAEPQDFRGNRWNRPEHKMKMGVPHTVMLSKEALARVPKARIGFLFCPQDAGVPMHENVLMNLLEPMGYKGRFTVHGMRATFITWAMNEVRSVEQWLPDMATAHAVKGTMVDYHRETALAKCLELFEVWACYLNGGQWRKLRAEQLARDLAEELAMA